MPPRSRRFSGTIVSIATLSAIVLTGCATTSGNDGTATDTIRSAWLTDPTTFDPAKVSGLDDFRAARLGFDTVLRRDDDGIVGGIASDYTQSPTNVTLTIRDGLVCGDGEAITPTLVADSLTRLASADTASTTAPLIFGGSAVTVTPDDAAGTVSVDLERAYSELAVGLTVPAAGIVCPAGIADPEGLAAGTVPGAFSGPYALSSSTPGVSYEYTLRDDYDAWPEYANPLEGTPAAKLAFAVGGTDAVPNQLLTGELDAANVQVQDLARFEDSTYELNNSTVGDYFIIFNESETSPFADPAVRTAAAQVIDPSAFMEAVNPAGQLIYSAGDPDLQCVNTDESLLVEQDEDAAASVLDGLTIRVIGTTGIGVNGAGNVYVQERLRAAGANVELANVDNGNWITTILGPDTDTWDITVFATINNVGTMVTGLSRVLGSSIEDGGRNVARSDNPVASAAYIEALSASDDTAKCEAYQRAQEASLDAVDFIPLSTNPSTIVTAEGFSVRAPGGREDLTTLRILG